MVYKMALVIANVFLSGKNSFGFIFKMCTDVVT